MVFTAASISLPYTAVSVLFRWLPSSFAGPHVGTGWHALTWALAVAGCEILAGRGQHFLIVGAVKLSDPKVRLRDMDLSLQALEGDFLKVDLGVLITIAVALTPAMVIVALPTVFLVRRFLEHPILVAQSRVDSKTGLLNVSTWESEAESEISRSTRSHQPVALCLVDIDHFKRVNDTYGHLVGDKVLKSVAGALTSLSRDYDRAGRFGGEEFVLLLAQTTQADAMKIAERIRAHVEGLAVPVDDRPGSPTVQVTISIGVTALARGESHELIDLLAAADSALYQAKQSGRNQVAMAPADRNMGLDAFNAHQAASNSAGDPRPVADPHHAPAGQSPRAVQVHVQANPTPLSLCQNRSLSVPVKRQDESNSLK
jgi:diguanylate cyclase (GGDEF)-like protein